MYFGCGLILIGILFGAVLGQQQVLVQAVSLPGFAVAFVVAMAAHFIALRCPRCRGNLDTLIMQRGWLSVHRSVRFCPYCGCGLDEELPQEGAAER